MKLGILLSTAILCSRVIGQGPVKVPNPNEKLGPFAGDDKTSSKMKNL